MGEKEFLMKCKEIVVNYVNKNLDVTDGKKISVEDVYIPWSAKVLQNNKATASTTLSDGMYYELTHNGDKGEIYLDVYKKWENISYQV